MQCKQPWDARDVPGVGSSRTVGSAVNSVIGAKTVVIISLTRRNRTALWSRRFWQFCFIILVCHFEQPASCVASVGRLCSIGLMTLPNSMPPSPHQRKTALSSSNSTRCTIISKKSNKLWIWKAYCRNTGQLVDWECGDRDQNTLTRLLDRLKTWKVVLYCTDAYAPYDHALPVGRHFQGKEQTWRLEQNNGQQRHWYRRFQRRTLVVSKSVRMVDRTMAMFARFHVNGSLEDIAHLFGFPAIAAILGEGS